MLSGLCGCGPTSTRTGSRSAINSASAAVSITVPPSMLAGTGPPIGPVQKPSGSGAVSRSGAVEQAESNKTNITAFAAYNAPAPLAGEGYGALANEESLGGVGRGVTR